MDDNKMETVSFLAYEASQTRLDRIIHRLILALVVSIVALFITNALWIWAWMGHGQVTVETKDGTTNYVGNDGVITNGD